MNYQLNLLSELPSELFDKDFLLTWDKSVDELKKVIITAEILKELHKDGFSMKSFESGLAVSLFRDNSTRTRFSFASACNLLGLTIQDLDEGKSQISHGETVRETATMISFLTEVIGIRDDMYLGAGHEYMKKVGAALDESFKEKVIAQRPMIVNLQCDVDHPTQSMSDLTHLKRRFGNFDNLKGKKLAMTWAYSPSYGKPLSVPQGVIGLMTRFGMDVTLAHPEGYELMPETIDLARKNASESGGSFKISNSMEDAFKNANVVYPKSWAPYQVMKRRTSLLRKNETGKLADLEKECLAQNSKYQNWECTEKMMGLGKNGDPLYMHCLPADISGVSCARGEVADSVFERHRLSTYNEAAWKPFIIAAMIINGKFKEPTKLLEKLIGENNPRHV